MAEDRTSDPARTLVGAAAAGTSPDSDPAAAPAPPDPRRRKYRLRSGEPIPAGMRRIASGQLFAAAGGLAAADDVTLGAAVHDARKRVKRVRAVLRLSRSAIGDDVYDRENGRLREVGGRLSTARDAQVLIETLDELERRHRDDLPAHATAELRARLQDEHARALRALTGEGIVESAVRELEQAGARTAQWVFEHDDFAALEPSLRRIYRRGRKRLRAACAQPSAENLHECRKRVKDLWHVTQVLRHADPKAMKRVSRRAHDLADLIGDHHDLSVLRDYVEVHPHHFEDPPAREALLAAIDERRRSLARRALKLGRRVYERSPKRFTAKVKQGWRKRAATR